MTSNRPRLLGELRRGTREHHQVCPTAPTYLVSAALPQPPAALRGSFPSPPPTLSWTVQILYPEAMATVNGHGFVQDREAQN